MSKRTHDQNEIVIKEIEIIKKNKTDILELKNSMNETNKQKSNREHLQYNGEIIRQNK